MWNPPPRSDGLGGIWESDPIPSGPITAASVAAFFAGGGKTLLLGPGDYTIDAPLVLPSGCAIVGAGSGLTRIVPGYTPSIGLASDTTNTLIKVMGALNTGVMNTTNGAAPCAEGDRRIACAAVVTIAADQWGWIGGNNTTGTDELNMSDGTAVVVAELFQAATAVAASANIPLKWPLSVHHSNGSSILVKGATVVVGVLVKGVDLVGDSSTHAAGISCRYASDIRIEDVRGGGFTMAIVVLQDSRHVYVDIVDRHGGNGSLFIMSGMQHVSGKVRSFPGTPNVAGSPDTSRYKVWQGTPLGVPHHDVFWRDRCAWIDLQLDLCGGTGGLRPWGGHHCRAVGTISDMYSYAIHSTNHGGLGLDLLTTEPYGVGLDGGCNPLSDASFAEDCYYEFTLSECRNPGTTTEQAFVAEAHDAFRNTWILRINGTGRSGFQASNNGTVYYQAGIYCQDVIGVLDLQVKGMLNAWRTSGVFAQLLSRFKIDGGPGIGTSTSIGTLNHGAGMGSSPMWEMYVTDHTSNEIRSESTFAAAPDWNVHIRWYNPAAEASLAGFANVILANNATGVAQTVGDWVVFDHAAGAAGGERRVLVPSVGDVRTGGVVAVGAASDLGTGLILVATGGYAQAHVDAATVQGQRLKASTYNTGANGDFTPDDAATYETCKAVALAKIAGAGIIPVRLVGI